MSDKDRLPLNSAVIQSFVVDACGGDVELVLGMVDFFLKSAAGLALEMEAGLAAQNWPDVRRAAHSLKSSSRMFSADTLTQLCLDTEKRAIDKEESGIAELLPQIQAELAWLVTELPAFCRAMLA